MLEPPVLSDRLSNGNFLKYRAQLQFLFLKVEIDIVLKQFLGKAYVFILSNLFPQFGCLLDAKHLSGCLNCFIKWFGAMFGLAVGRGMNTADDLSLSPASDCNSNNVETSYASNTSDLEFIQDNSDYQWCVDYGYREVSHRSVLSSCYDELARDLDSQLAQVDMEDYSAQEILSTLPAICCPEIQAERQGEMFASVSGSLMVKFDFDSSLSPHTSSQDESSMSLGHSEPLFSPVREATLPNYSVDSLDEGDSMMSVEDKPETKMAASDAPTTTWSKLRKCPRGQRSRSKTVSLPDLGQGAPCLSASLALGGCVKLYDIQNSGSATSESFSGSGGPDLSGAKQGGNFSLLRMFIAQRANSADQTSDNRAERQDSDSPSLSACYEDSLVRESGSSVERLSSKSPSICTCSLSASSNKFNVNNNNSIERDTPTKVTTGTVMSGVSEFSAATNSSDPVTGDTKICPLHTVDRAIQTSVREPSSKEFSKEDKKPVYVLYPNYTLPDLGFLRGGPSAERVLLAPVKYTSRSPGTPPSVTDPTPHRTITRRDLESLRQKGLDHVMDWSSLTPLLPSEYWSLLCELPQVRQHSGNRLEKPAFLTSPTPPPGKESNPPPTPNFAGKTNVNSSGCSTATAPSSGYRGSSTLLSESGGPANNTPACNTPANNPLYVYNYSGEERRTRRGQEGKRYSMFEFGALEDNINEADTARKRKSYPAQQHKEDEETNECWDDWWRDTTKRPHSPPSAHANRLDQLLELSGNDVSWQPQDIRTLRDQVSKFLSETGRKCVSFADKGDQQLTPPNSPTYQKGYHCKQGGLSEMKQFPEESCRSRYDFTNKKKLLERVIRGVEKVLEVAREGEHESLPSTVLDSLCPPLYSLLSDGLRPKIETAFGPIGNSVWQVVEASAQQGPMTRALHELVMKLNSEDVLSEGLIKFNAFIFGLLNVHGMDAWMSYIRTRESILSKHYTEESLFLSASRGHAKSRSLTDSLLAALKPLSRVDFHLDLLYETRLLHESLLQLAVSKLPLSPSGGSEITTDSLLLKKIVQSIKSGLSAGTTSSEDHSLASETPQQPTRNARPRSCIDPGQPQQDVASTARKRWSTVHVGSRLASAYDRLQSPNSQESKTIESGGKSTGSEESLEADEENKKTGGKFRSLQRKWELLSGRDQENKRILRSRIPRPVTSPVRPVTTRVPTPASLQRRALSSIPTQRSSSREFGDAKRTEVRPRTGGFSRPPAPSKKTVSNRSSIPRTVVTLTHRLPSDSGHLAFNEGERLRLVLEVDDSWLLCCRGDAKGLVPRSAVI
ncbi:serine-rich adhesin for platelets isoform X4 [Halyomorpha halys]|uniref:serine-rich adhesin for platelets isoform X4 n=1 Tax=Halyomorpha halys TaxID=286706 RepID=UPI0034D1B4E1